MRAREITESLKQRQVKELKQMFNKPIPLNQAIHMLSPYIVDQDLSAIIDNELQVKGNKDARDLISSWLKQNMPDLYKQPFERAAPFESPIMSHPDIKEE
jgi:hypothetical protein